MMAEDIAKDLEPSIRPTEPPRRGSRLIGRVLPMAIRLWLKTKVEQLENLSLQLQGSDRQILAGHIPGLLVSAQRVIYRGLHLSEVELTAQEMRINLSQILRGKPLKLLQAFPVGGRVKLTGQDLNQSLNAAYLAEGIGNFWQTLLGLPEVMAEILEVYGQPIQPVELLNGQSHASIDQERLTLGILARGTDPQLLKARYKIGLQTGLMVENYHLLKLQQPCWLTEVGEGKAIYPSKVLVGFQWDLGSDACLQELTVASNQIICRGKVIVKP